MRVLRLVFLGVFAFSIFFASWYVLHEDLYFGADQARDFHILREIDEKKIIIIGPRASGDLFHGPGWPYLNYPLFVLGSGNPVAVGWGWVILTLFSGGIAYYVGKKLFDIKVGYLFGTMTVLYTAFHAKGMINPHGVMLLLPLFFYFFVKYFQTSNQKFLALNLIVGGIMIQMELMSVPLLALSVGAMSFKMIKEKKLRHLTSLLLIFLFLTNFIAFDLRHDFLLTQRFFNFASPQGGPIHGYYDFFINRLDLAFQGTEILRRNIGPANLLLFLATLGLIFFQIKKGKHRLIYLSF